MVTSRKRADELDRRLGEARSGIRPARPDDDVAPLVDTALRLQALSPVRRSQAPTGPAGPAGPSGPGFPPDPAFRARLRHRVVAEARSLAPARASVASAHAVHATAARAGGLRGAPSAPRRRRPALLTGLVAAVVAVGTATSVASSAALPGDLLYPVKRSAEDARLFVPRSEASRGAAELDLARERLGESWRLAASGTEPDPAALEAVLAELGTSAGEGVTVLLQDFEERGDPASLAEVQDFLVTAIPSMRDLRALLPPPARGAARDLVTQWVGAQRSLVETAVACGSRCAGVLG